MQNWDGTGHLPMGNASSLCTPISISTGPWTSNQENLGAMPMKQLWDFLGACGGEASRSNQKCLAAQRWMDGVQARMAGGVPGLQWVLSTGGVCAEQ
jgi:hypothetical protein